MIKWIITLYRQYDILIRRYKNCVSGRQCCKKNAFVATHATLHNSYRASCSRSPVTAEAVCSCTNWLLPSTWFMNDIKISISHKQFKKNPNIALWTPPPLKKTMFINFGDVIRLLSICTHSTIYRWRSRIRIQGCVYEWTIVTSSSEWFSICLA